MQEAGTSYPQCSTYSGEQGYEGLHQFGCFCRDWLSRKPHQWQPCWIIQVKTNSKHSENFIVALKIHFCSLVNMNNNNKKKRKCILIKNPSSVKKRHKSFLCLEIFCFPEQQKMQCLFNLIAMPRKVHACRWLVMASISPQGDTFKSEPTTLNSSVTALPHVSQNCGPWTWQGILGG